MVEVKQRRSYANQQDQGPHDNSSDRPGAQRPGLRVQASVRPSVFFRGGLGLLGDGGRFGGFHGNLGGDLRCGFDAGGGGFGSGGFPFFVVENHPDEVILVTRGALRSVPAVAAVVAQLAWERDLQVLLVAKGPVDGPRVVHALSGGSGLGDAVGVGERALARFPFRVVPVRVGRNC